jgi:hypothetical protein
MSYKDSIICYCKKVLCKVVILLISLVFLSGSGIYFGFSGRRRTGSLLWAGNRGRVDTEGLP